MSLAVVVISHDKRLDKLGEVVRSILWQRPDELVIVADSARPTDWPKCGRGERWLTVAPVTMTTLDALIKRDVGWMATTSDYICYLADDHALAPGFVTAFHLRYAYKEWDILCPQRFCICENAEVPLNVGQREGYAGGHCAIYKRWVNHELPWMAGAHHPNWDVLSTQAQIAAGAKLAYADRDLLIEDLEPEREPWR